MPLFSRLVPAFTSAYAFQTLCALIFVPQAQEKYYDLCGSLGFLTTAATSLYYPSVKAYLSSGTPLPALSTFAPRQLLISAALGIWAARLGTFLASRAIRAGGDSRFDEIKHQPQRFTYYWMAQATWVTLVGLPVYLSNALPASLHPRLGPLDYVGVALAASSFVWEVTADRQKTAWKQAKDRKEHEEKFITSGLWSVSRHPNYVGEVGIWTGVWILSVSALRSSFFPTGLWLGAAISPFFTWLITRNASGVPPLERAGDKKWGTDPKWIEYKRTVPVFWPWGGYR